MTDGSNTESSGSETADLRRLSRMRAFAVVLSVLSLSFAVAAAWVSEPPGFFILCGLGLALGAAGWIIGESMWRRYKRSVAPSSKDASWAVGLIILGMLAFGANASWLYVRGELLGL